MRFILVFTFLFLTLSNPAHAAVEIWKMGDSFFEYSRDPHSKLLIASHCLKSPCEAKEVLKTVSFKNISSPQLTGGKNPASILCQSLHNAQLVILRNLDGNENSFCWFSDQSSISNGSLESQARINDQK